MNVEVGNLHTFLLDERSIKPSSLGDARLSREASEKNTAKTKKLARQLIIEFLPSLARLPACIEQYEPELSRLLASFDDKFSTLGDLKDAYLYLAKFVRAGTAAKNWQVVPPPVPTVLMRPPSGRRYTEFTAESDAVEIAVQFKAAIQNPDALVNHSPEKLRALIVFSAANFGGLCNSTKLTTLFNVLSKSKPLTIGLLPGSRSIHIGWIDMTIDSDNCRIANCRDEDNAYLETRFLVDPHTLHLCLNYFQTRKNVQEEIVRSEKEVFQILVEALELLGVWSSQFSSLRPWAKAAAGSVECLGSVSLSKAIVNGLRGDVPNVPLNHADWTDLFSGKIDWEVSLKYKAMSFQSSRRHKKREYARLESVSEETGKVHEEIDAALPRKGVGGTKAKPSTSIGHLKATLELCKTDSSRLYVEWLVSLMEVRGNKVATANRYHDAIGADWLLQTQDIDILDFDGLDFTVLYNQILDICASATDRYYTASRLQDFHKFLTSNEKIANLERPLVDRVGSTSVVRSGFLGASMVDAAKQAILRTTGVNRETISLLYIAFILVIRCGLRPEEIVRIKVSYISGVDLKWLFIEGNEHGDGKSASSPRYIPLRALLMESELTNFQKFYERRRSGKENELLLAAPGIGYGIWWDSHELGRYFSQVLRAVTGNHSRVFYDARHTALSTIFLIMERKWEILTCLTGYSQDQGVKIRQEIIGNEIDVIQQHWAGAAFAAHASPERTFASYNHMCDFAVFWELYVNSGPISRNAARSLAGFSSQYLSAVFGVGNRDELELSGLYRVLIQKLKPWTGKNLAPIDCDVELDEKEAAEVPISQTKLSLREIQHIIDIYYSAEDRIEAFRNIESMYDVEDGYLRRILTVTEALGDMQTRESQNRVISKTRQDKKMLVPFKIGKVDEEDQLKRCYENFQDQYSRLRTEIDWCVIYFLRHSKISGSGIRFTKSVEFTRFINTFGVLCKDESWRLIFSAPADIELDELSGEWIKSDVAVECEMNERADPNRRSVTAYLHLRHPNEKKLLENNSKNKSKTKFKRYTSSSLRWLIHFIAIATLDVETAKGLSD